MTKTNIALHLVTAMHQMQDGRMHDDGMGPWMWLWMALWGLVGIAVLVLAVVAIVFLARSIRRIHAGGPRRSGEVQT